MTNKWIKEHPEEWKKSFDNWKARNPNYSKDWYRKNKKKIIAKKKKYNKEHKEEIAKWQKEYHQRPEIKENDKIYGKNYRKTHRKEIAERIKKWRRRKEQKN